MGNRLPSKERYLLYITTYIVKPSFRMGVQTNGLSVSFGVEGAWRNVTLQGYSAMEPYSVHITRYLVKVGILRHVLAR